MFTETTPMELKVSQTDTKKATLPLVEDFYTIQGEGFYAGKPAYFIRTAGCDVNCWWCDVPESWEESDHPVVKIDKVVERAGQSGAPFAVITGGEPLLHDLDPISRALNKAGLNVHIETSGSSPLLGQLDWVTLSPKRFKKPLDEVYPHVDELKVVVLTNKDLQWAEETAAQCPDHTQLLLQPEWSRESSRQLIVEYVKQNPQWGISIQTHKHLGVR